MQDSEEKMDKRRKIGGGKAEGDERGKVKETRWRRQDKRKKKERNCKRGGKGGKEREERVKRKGMTEERRGEDKTKREKKMTE